MYDLKLFVLEKHLPVHLLDLLLEVLSLVLKLDLRFALISNHINRFVPALLLNIFGDLLRILQEIVGELVSFALNGLDVPLAHSIAVRQQFIKVNILVVKLIQVGIDEPVKPVLKVQLLTFLE